MRYLITGAGGMLGSDLAAALRDREVTTLTRAQLDITDAAACRDAVGGHDVVINCAAYTSVDAAESHEDAAYAVNAEGAGNLAAATRGTFVQLSTDYVFAGTASAPYPEDAPLDPVSAYGRTKAAGERLARAANPSTIVVRTAWLYGANGSSFPRTILRLAHERDEVAVVTDEIGQPSWTVDVASRIVALIDSGAASGTFHATSSGQASWYEFARATLEVNGLPGERITPTTAAEFRRAAPRPAYAVLGHAGWSAVGFPPMRDWRAALEAATEQGVFNEELEPGP